MNVRISLLLCVLLAVFHVVPSSSQNFFNPSIAVASDARCAVVYNTAASDGGKVFLSLVGRENRLPDTPATVNGDLNGYGQNPAVACGPLNRVSLVWEQWHAEGGSSIYRAQFGMDGMRLTPMSECVLDTPAINAQTPRIAIGTDGREIIVWLDYRLGYPAIYAQRYTSGGRKEGRNIRIADGGGSVLQTPAVCVTVRNEVGIVWQETIRDSFRVVFASADWNLKKFERVIIDKSHGQAYASTPDAASVTAGVYWTVWKDYRTGESNIFRQRVTRRNGTGRDTNHRLNDDTTRNWQRLPRIAASPLGLLAVWEDYRDDSQNQAGDIIVQMFDRQGRAIGSNIRVNDSPEPTIQRFPAVGMNARGDWAIVWSDSRSGMTEVYLRRGALKDPVMEARAMRIAP